jgi:hypothetical protein
VEAAVSTWETHALACASCGHHFTVPLLKGMHITRLPDVKQAIREGTFQVFPCPSCAVPTAVEKATVYTDFDAGHYVAIEPPSDLAWREAKERHQKVYDEAFLLGPGAAAELATRTLHRLVFGNRALREKVLAWDAGLDDALVAKLELMKRESMSFVEHEVRLVAVLPPGDHLLFAQYHRRANAGARTAGRPTVIAHHTVRREAYDALIPRREEVRGTYWWVFDDWFVDATHRLLHPDATA